jgi:coniferyl-aldehyde dehydrogenase
VERLRDVIARQKQHLLDNGAPSYELRADRIRRTISLLVENKANICEAVAADFSWRSHDLTLMTDILGTVEGLKHNAKHLRRWMKPERRKAQFPLNILGAKALIHYQPVGAVGIVGPWNFPIHLAFAPLGGALAAGNSAMIKPSEFTPATSELMDRLVRSYFDETEVAVFTGGPDVGAEFSRQPFDHLVFTGSTRVGRMVMRAAAENLTPVTLELGGKSPVIIGKGANIQVAAKRIAWGKALNSGQICIAPDYVLVPQQRLQEFVSAFKESITAMYPSVAGNPDYTSIVNQLQYDRLCSYIEDAKSRNIEVVEINPQNEDFTGQGTRKLPPMLVIDPTDDSLIMQNEIFGPLLVIKSYRLIEDVIQYINAGSRPLALYYFGDNQAEQDLVLGRTWSGGACVNDVVVHAMQDDLPFGGCGASGMGAYHGEAGFKRFSHAKAVFSSSTKFDALGIMRPPYGNAIRRVLRFALGR